MAGVGWEGKCARIVYRDGAGVQHTIRLGKCPKSVANTARMAIGHLIIAKRHGSVPHPDAVRWLAGIDALLYSRVVKHGLCQPRTPAHDATVTLGELIERVESMATVKTSTRAAYRQAENSLIEHFGVDRPLTSIRETDADAWRAAIGEPGVNSHRKGVASMRLAPATIAKRTGIVKNIFRKAVRWKMISSNPFEALRVGPQTNPARAFYISCESIRAILKECPDTEWRAIVALSRFAGLRCPSEVAALTWHDIDWQHRRMIVRSSKTEGHEGGAVRTVPIAPELIAIMQNLYDSAEVGAEAIVPRLRRPGTNLRTHLHRIIERAGLTPWPRLFQNLRASCECDWAERFPAHVAAKWLGHSPLIAARHYLQTRDMHFDRAAGLDDVEKAAAYPAAQGRTPGTTQA